MAAAKNKSAKEKITKVKSLKTKSPKTPKAPKPAASETLELAKTIFMASLDVKAEQPLCLDLRGLTSFTDFFVIASGRSERQVQALAERILERLREQKIKPLGTEGYESSRWILLDFGSVVVHLFYPESRAFYEIERLWTDAPKLAWNEKGKLIPAEDINLAAANQDG